ncbi:MAG: aminotransferase class V-fold PLP-dependent enzyme [Ectothiorhodospiraceae bacterium]|nr:aminotransferase class V-fold PLP-dependent enzyme [Ectothiorhodospiraceae bacterium]
MTVRHGREFLTIPGPTTVPDEVLGAMHRPAVDIYASDLPALTDSCLADLARVFRTGGHVYIYIANGHGVWEAALSNVLSRGDRVLAVGGGLFTHAWAEMARMNGIEVELMAGDSRRAVEPGAVEARLRADTAGALKAVLLVQVDTATGVVNDVRGVRAAIDAAGHGALLMVDGIASIGVVPFEMDAWGVDVAITASQKGLMMTPGLGFVAAGPKARAVHQHANLRTQYWDWTFREGPLHYQKYCGTPPEHMLFGLRRSLDMLLEEGLEAAWHRQALLARAVRAAVTVWAEGGAIEFNASEPAERADSVTTVRTAAGASPAALLDYCRTRCGVVLGIGIGPLDGKAFRIAHMGHVNAPMILGALGVVEMGLRALGIAHGRGGIQAAVELLADAVPP